MNVPGTFQTSSSLHPPLPVMHTPARKVKADSKHKEWRVNPLARLKAQKKLGETKINQKYSKAMVAPHQHSVDSVAPQQYYNSASNLSPSSRTSSPHKRNEIVKGSGSAQGEITESINDESQNIDHTRRLQILTSSNQQTFKKTTPGRHKFDGVRKTQYLSLNNKFSNLTMALNTAYKKSQEQAEKRLKTENKLQEKSGQIMSC